MNKYTSMSREVFLQEMKVSVEEIIRDIPLYNVKNAVMLGNVFVGMSVFKNIIHSSGDIPFFLYFKKSENIELVQALHNYIPTSPSNAKMWNLKEKGIFDKNRNVAFCFLTFDHYKDSIQEEFESKPTEPIFYYAVNKMKIRYNERGYKALRDIP